MTSKTQLLCPNIDQLNDGEPFFILTCENNDKSQILRGIVIQPNLLNDIPRNCNGPIIGECQYDTVSMIPFCQIRERGFKAHRDNETILCLKVSSAEEMSTADLAAALPVKQVVMEGALEYDRCTEDYEEVIRDLLEKEIRGGEGSSFVTPRVCRGKIYQFDLDTALAIYRRILEIEKGTYWKFLFYDGDENYFIGASPERHLSVKNDQVVMNPISGTFRKSCHENSAQVAERLDEFLRDPKEIDELFMVTDEELKMMCKICPEGGDIIGPSLKEMTYVAHTEYTLQGKAGADDMLNCFRDSMFAPTVTGSPMGNACARLYHYETQSRRYYSSAVLLMGKTGVTEAEHKKDFLDSCITIRTQEFSKDGSFSIRVGATLVKDSVPSEEVKETEAKLEAVVKSLAKLDTSKNDLPLSIFGDVYPNEDKAKEIMQTLTSRNDRVSKFWFQSQLRNGNAEQPYRNYKVLLMNNEDDFVNMIQYILKYIGFTCETVPFNEFQNKYDSEDKWDLVILGPGPGDPTDARSEKMGYIKNIINKFLKSGQRFIGVCLAHQCLGCVLGMAITKKAVPQQGVQKEIDLFGTKSTVGFYNSFMVVHQKDGTALQDAEFSFDEPSGELYAIRTKQYVTFQFHPESILTVEGLNILKSAARHLLGNS